MKRSLAKKYILAIIGFAILVFIDQWTKQLAVLDKLVDIMLFDDMYFYLIAV